MSNDWDADSDPAPATLQAEEAKAQIANDKAEARRKAGTATRKKKRTETKAEREAKAAELDDLLKKSAAFSEILTKKTEILGRVGTGLDGQTLGEHDLKMAMQPKCMVGGTMRDYQLEGLTWMYEICLQGMSGILADEMGLGKTVQTISLIALLREQEGYLGPHLVVAPLSTLSNWMDEFRKWVPSIPVVLYHGDPHVRQGIRDSQITCHMSDGSPTRKFPVVCTSYEIILRDKTHLSKVGWGFIIIDEGHRMKNFDSKLFRELKAFRSATRLLITGTPLQNNLRELWSLLNFLLPEIFVNWDAFENWFDFSDLEDEQGTQEFITDRAKQDLVKKIHLILQPLLLRRVKADVASYLPKKREYVLFAPMTEEQIGLYSALSDRDIDARAFLEDKVDRHFDKSRSGRAGAVSTRPADSDAEGGHATGSKLTKNMTPTATKLALRGRPIEPAGKNAFDVMMNGKNAKDRDRDSSSSSAAGTKRKAKAGSVPSPAKSVKSTLSSTPSAGLRKRVNRYVEDYSDDDLLDDDAFEAKLTDLADEEEKCRALKTAAERPGPVTNKALELAKKEIANKKLGNPLMQLRLVCNSPHNFFNPFSSLGSVDESIVTCSGKMLLLDRLLPALFERGHKVLIFSQFQTQLDLIQDYCTELRRWNICRIDGSVAQESRQEQISQFNDDPNIRIFLLSTRAGGQGINLAAADTVVLFDSDWNPQQDLQAQDRCHRIGQTRPVVVYRLATKGTVEESLLLSADAKRRLEKLVIKKGGFKTMGRNTGTPSDEGADALDSQVLRSLLLKDGQEYTWRGGGVLSDQDIDLLLDRSDEAYARAAGGLGDADGWKVVETGANGTKTLAKGEDTFKD